MQIPSIIIVLHQLFLHIKSQRSGHNNLASTTEIFLSCVTRLKLSVRSSNPFLRFVCFCLSPEDLSKTMLTKSYLLYHYCCQRSEDKFRRYIGFIVERYKYTCIWWWGRGSQFCGRQVVRFGRSLSQFCAITVHVANLLPNSCSCTHKKCHYALKASERLAKSYQVLAS